MRISTNIVIAVIVGDRGRAPQVLDLAHQSNIAEREVNTPHLLNTAQLRRQIVIYNLKRLLAIQTTCQVTIQASRILTDNNRSLHRLSTETRMLEEAWLHTVLGSNSSTREPQHRINLPKHLLLLHNNTANRIKGEATMNNFKDTEKYKRDHT